MKHKIKDVKRAYIDANLFIYLIENTDNFNHLAVKIFESLLESEATIYTSELSFIECSVGCYKNNAVELLEHYRNFFFESSFIETIELGRDMVYQAAEIAGHYGTKLVDSMHIASAKNIGCDLIITNDKGIKNYDKIKVLSLKDTFD